MILVAAKANEEYEVRGSQPLFKNVTKLLFVEEKKSQDNICFGNKYFFKFTIMSFRALTKI